MGSFPGRSVDHGGGRSGTLTNAPRDTSANGWPRIGGIQFDQPLVELLLAVIMQAQVIPFILGHKSSFDCCFLDSRYSEHLCLSCPPPYLTHLLHSDFCIASALLLHIPQLMSE